MKKWKPNIILGFVFGVLYAYLAYCNHLKFHFVLLAFVGGFIFGFFWAGPLD